MLYLLNAPICHTPGLRYTTRNVSRAEALKLVGEARGRDGITSAIGHEGSAQVLSLVLDHPVPVNRITMAYKAGDTAIALQLRQRQPEGVVLTSEAVEAIGYDLTLITTAPAPVCVIYGSAVAAAQRIAAGEVITYDSRARPHDIDVTYGGMDVSEARDLALAWAQESGLATFGLALDFHPELTHPHPACFLVESGVGRDMGAFYDVKLPYPAGAPRPDSITIAGAPVVSWTTADNLASLMRRLAGEEDTLEVGKALAGWIANNRDGLRVAMTPTRKNDEHYKEGSLAGLRAGWRHLATSRQRHRDIIEHINGYVAGMGDMIAALVAPVHIVALAKVAALTGITHSGNGFPEVTAIWGEMRIHRIDNGPVWGAFMGDTMLTLPEAARFLHSGELSA